MNNCVLCGGVGKLRCVKYNDVILYYYVVCSKCGTVSKKCDNAIVAMQCWNGQNLTGQGFTGGEKNDG